jgi:hypothetical protein
LDARHYNTNYRGDTAERFELFRNVSGGDGTTDTLTVTTGATEAQRFGLLGDVTRGDGTPDTLTITTGETQTSGLNCCGT